MASESGWNMPTGELMKGKKGLIMGVANSNSIAWGIASQLAAQGAELAFHGPDAHLDALPGLRAPVRRQQRVRPLLPLAAARGHRAFGHDRVAALYV